MARGPRHAVGRADLLRVLAVAAPDTLALDQGAAGWFGYIRQQERQPPQADGPVVQVRPQDAPTAPETGPRLPLQMPFTWAILARETQEQDPIELETAPQPSGPLTDKDVAPLKKKRQVGYEDLVPPARLLPALRRHLGATRAGPFDLERIVADLAYRRFRQRLPRASVRCWHPGLVVVLDFSRRLWPYRTDMHRLARRLACLCGASGLSLRLLEHGPDGPWSDWLEHQNPHTAAPPPEHPWRMPAPGTPVLLVGDLGRLRGAASAVAQAWTDFVGRLKRAQLRPLALMPLGLQQIDEALARLLPVLRWSPDASPHPAGGTGTPRATPDGLAELLALMAVSRRVDPPLLRALRRHNPVAPLNAGLEGAAWCHADVQAGLAAAIRPDRQGPHLKRFRSLAHDPVTIAALCRKHHAHWPAPLRHEEALLWCCYAPPAAHHHPDADAWKREAETFFAQLEETLDAPLEAASPAGDWDWVAQSVLQRARGSTLGHRFPVLQRLARRLKSHPGADAPAILGDPVPAWLVQDAAGGCLRLQTAPAGPRQVGLGEPLRVDDAGLAVEGPGGTRMLFADRLPADLGPLDTPQRLHLETPHAQITVGPVHRPRGALGWSCGQDGVAVTSPPLAGKTATWSQDKLSVVLPEDATPGSLEAVPTDPQDIGAPDSKTRATVQFGIDAAFGTFADLTLETQSGAIVQRFRWIEPGTFWMGSPPEESERIEREGPQHPVTLTRGFWLADTACTQALWQAVMDKNPSRFKGPDLPVDNVSWPDVQDFLKRLSAIVPGCGADLPTEAEWEYACRAGTVTPFSFGATITPEQVNYDGNHPYAGAEKGQNRGESVPVKSLPPNPWGLYEMHGNVWEWCADGQRRYTVEAQVDPRGPEEQDGQNPHRVLRGGSWLYDAWIARSAYRDASHPGLRRGGPLGFRLCLRSSEPGRGPGRTALGRPPGQPGGRPKGRRRTPPWA